ncbi:MAG: X-Pro dipeptidyl-peptidase [Mycobacterium sp.]|nr:X-Pro dipeptidyl-peptidase [Mycobacterium sp.]
MANGVPTKVLWFCGGHGVCTNNLFDPTDGQVITTQTLAWLAHYVKGQQDVSTGPQFEWVDQRGQFYSSATYPAAPAATIVASSTGAGALPLIPLLGGSGPLLFVLPIGGTRAINAFNLTTPAATQTTYVVGAPQLTLTYSGTGTSRHVFAQLVDDATGAVLGNQVTPIPVTLDGQSHTVTIPLEQVAHTLSAGQTLTLQVVASTANYENFGSFGVLNVANLGVSLPTITDAVARTASPASLSA